MLTIANNKETSVCTMFVRCVKTLNLLFRLDKNLEENTVLSSISSNGEIYAQYVLTLCDLLYCSPPGSYLRNFLGKKTGAGCHFSSRGSSWPRDQTYISRVSCIGRKILYHRTTREANDEILLFSRSVMCNSGTPWTEVHQVSLSFTISWSLLKLMSIELMMSHDEIPQLKQFYAG